MDFDREYQKPRRPETPDDFIDCNVQALVEGRRKHALPRPNLGQRMIQAAEEAREIIRRERRSYLRSL